MHFERFLMERNSRGYQLFIWLEKSTEEDRWLVWRNALWCEQPGHCSCGKWLIAALCPLCVLTICLLILSYSNFHSVPTCSIIIYTYKLSQKHNVKCIQNILMTLVVFGCFLLFVCTVVYSLFWPCVEKPILHMFNWSLVIITPFYQSLCYSPK